MTTSPSKHVHPQDSVPNQANRSSLENPNSDMPHDPESPKTLTLETPCPQTAQQEVDPDQTHIQEDPSTGNTEIPAPTSPSVTDLQVNSSIASRLGGGPKRKKKGSKLKRRGKEKNFAKNLEMLNEKLKLIPFAPPDLDFSRHEKLLKRLGLWDFVRLEFHRSLRTDLICQLIASYGDRCGYVNGARINVSRADLARALKLPVKKDKDTAVEEEESEESVSFIQDFLSKWVLLHGDDEMWIMPSEVLNWTKAIKEGHFGKLDWASLIWFMVEKELRSVPKLGNCYYASHLQCLIKCQKEELMRDESRMEVDDKEEDDLEEGTGDVKMADGVDEPQRSLELEEHTQGSLELEEHDIELSLGGQEKVKKDGVEIEKEVIENDDVMDFEESKELEPDLCLLDRKSEGGSEHFLQRCNLGDVATADCEEDRTNDLREELEEGGEEDGQEEEEDEEEHEGGFPLSLKGESLDGMASTNLLEAMDAAQLPFSAGLQVQDNSSGDFLVSRVDTQSIPGSSSFLGSASKRDIGHENGTSHHALDGNNKRLRTDDQWHDKPSDFYTCLQEAHQLIAKAKMIYAEKEHSHNELNMNQQLLIDELQERQRIIEHLQKARYEEQRKRQVEVYRLEHELYMMGNLLDGYRKALKETHRAFAEYRARCPQADEPLYKDVKGSGGLVLSSGELEKQRLKKEEEERMNRLLFERQIKDFEAGWFVKLDAHKDVVFALDDRLISVEKDLKSLKASFENRRVSETPEHVPDES